MEDKDLRKYISDINEMAVVFDNPSFDNSIIGVSTDGRVIYDYDSMVDELMADEEMSYEDAADFIGYNTIRAIPYMENEGMAPIVMNKILKESV